MVNKPLATTNADHAACVLLYMTAPHSPTIGTMNDDQGLTKANLAYVRWMHPVVTFCEVQRPVCCMAAMHSKLVKACCCPGNSSTAQAIAVFSAAIGRLNAGS